jgi:hypothetical protein
MKLYERLPDSVIVGRKRVKLDLDFRNVLRLMETLQRDDLMPEARDWLAVKCVCRKPVKGTLQAVKELLFKDPPKGDGKRVTSFEQDAGLIRAAFRQVYGINLWTDSLHWIEFTELLQGIPEGNRYMETIGIRVREMPEPTKWNAKERAWLAKAKASVALNRTEQELEADYQRDVKSVFDALLPRAKEVKPCLTEGSNLKSPQTDEKPSQALIKSQTP